MKVRMYSIYDAKTCVFGKPMVSISDDAMIRDFADSVKDAHPNNMLNRHPEDYSLWFIGLFDDEKASLHNVKPENLISGSALRSAVSSSPVVGLNGNGSEATPVSN